MGITHVSPSVQTNLILPCDTALKGNAYSIVGVNDFCTAQDKTKEKLTQSQNQSTTVDEAETEMIVKVLHFLLDTVLQCLCHNLLNFTSWTL